MDNTSFSPLTAQGLVFPGSFEVETLPIDIAIPTGDAVVVETKLNLISPGTELALYTGTHVGLKNPGNTWAKYPFQPGYAAIGKVIATGSDSEVEVGTVLLSLAPHASHSILHGRPGVNFFVLPETSLPEHAAFARLAAITMTAPAVAPVQPGERVVVLGLGLIGNLAAQLYAFAGADVIGVDTIESRLEIARQCGIKRVLLSSDDLRTQLREMFGADPDLIVEATGVPALTNVALEAVRVRGRVVLLGSPRGSLEIDIYRHIHSRGVQLSGAHEGLQGQHGIPERHTFILKALDMIGKGQLNVAPLLTHRWPASQAREAYEMLLNNKDTALGVILDWD